MKKVAIVGSKNSPIADSVITKLGGIEFDCFEALSDKLLDYDLIICTEHQDKNNKYNILCSHYSLLPAFDTEEPVRDAILFGAKVTGITVLFTKPKRIIAQYPIFIHNETHYDELINQMKYVEQIFFPMVVEKLIKNELFESQYLMQSSKCGNCGDCNKCSRTK